MSNFPIELLDEFFYDAGRPARPTTAPASPQRSRMLRPPTAAERAAAQAAWEALCDERQSQRAQAFAEEDLDAEWRADQELAKLDNGRRVVSLFPGMQAAQLDALRVSLRDGLPSLSWLRQTRTRRAAAEANPAMPLDFLEDTVRLQRRQRMEGVMARIKAKVAAKAAPALKPKKPTLKRPPHKSA